MRASKLHLTVPVPVPAFLFVLCSFQCDTAHSATEVSV